MTQVSTPASIRQALLNMVTAINPIDAVEKIQQAEVIDWINSGAQLYRIKKPDIPPMHLVSYFVVLDRQHKKLLLADHIKAQLWLPTGGHVEPNESPDATVEREAKEELGIISEFDEQLGRQPLFISKTATVGLTAGHTDVSLWFVLNADSTISLAWDRNEFNAIRWFEIPKILSMDSSTLDPCMKRFVAKLAPYL